MWDIDDGSSWWSEGSVGCRCRVMLGGWLLVGYCWWVFISEWLLVGGCWWDVVGGWLLVGCCWWVEIGAVVRCSGVCGSSM